MKKDAAAYVKKCDKCQRHAPIPRAVGDIKTNFRPLTLRAVGHGHSRTPTAVVAQKKFLFVATDYFNKWVETEAYASIKDKDLNKFV